MKRSKGYVGYILLLLGGIFIDSPFFALLAIPLFLTGLVLVMIFYIGLVNKEKPPKWLYISTTIIGTIFLGGVLAYAAVEYNQFQVEMSRAIKEDSLINGVKILAICGVNCLAALAIYVGIRYSDVLNMKSLILVVLPSLIIVPLTILLINVMVLTGFWLGG